MKRLILCAAFAALASPALALSCLPHDVADIYKRASDAEETYIVVHGTLSFDESKLPKVDYNQQQNTPPDTMIRARLRGNAMSHSGFDHAFNQKIILNAKCLGPWCAGAKSGTDYLAFLERQDGNYTLVIDPCGGFGFAEPTNEVLDKAMQCLRGGPCKPDLY